MTKVYETYSADFTSRIQYAQRDDGQWFTRSQYRDPRYGYKWSKWQATAVAPRNTGAGQERRVRLPK
jgi:hypothetical protein